jgi:hypothetical protein
MSQSRIFKTLLDTLKLESNMAPDVGAKEFKQYCDAAVPYVDRLREEILAPDIATDSDRLKMLPSMLKCFSRILTKTASLTYAMHPKLVGAALDCLYALLLRLEQAASASTSAAASASAPASTSASASSSTSTSASASASASPSASASASASMHTSSPLRIRTSVAALLADEAAVLVLYLQVRVSQ